MSYARSPPPSLVITVGIRCISLPPRREADWSLWFGRRIGHRKVSAEVGHATQCFEGQRSRGQAKLDRRVLWPGALLGVRAEQARQVGVDLRGADVQGPSHGEELFRGHLLAAALHLGQVGG